jgi:hypothetical protein
MADDKSVTEKLKDKAGLGDTDPNEAGGSEANSGATGPEAISDKLSDARDEENGSGESGIGQPDEKERRPFD